MRRSAVVTIPAMLLIALLSGCFSEGPSEVVPVPDALIVVQGVLRLDQPQQAVLVERTVDGSGRGFDSGFIPGGTVARPVEGATVTLTNVSFPADPCGPVVTLSESFAAPADTTRGLYFSPTGCPTLRPGDTIDLAVVDDAETVTARTVIPAATGMSIGTGPDRLPVPGPRLTFNRDLDTLSVRVDEESGRVLLVEVGERRFLEPREFQAGSSSQFWVDGPELTLPGNLADVFGDFDTDDDVLKPLFRAGRYYRLNVAWADKNFFDQLRSENSEITGRGFINSIEGGYGFLGSMVAAETTLRVTGVADDPLEGAYNMTGTIDGTPVDVDWELYYGEVLPDGRRELSALVEGDWVHGGYDAWNPGWLDGSVATFFVFQPSGATGPDGPEIRGWELRGSLSRSGATTLLVVEDGVQVGTVEMNPR